MHVAWPNHSIVTHTLSILRIVIEAVVGWQVSSNQRGVNASQLNIGGTGLGSFNDRFRDAVLGGSPFASPLFQGWLTGTILHPSFVITTLDSDVYA